MTTSSCPLTCIFVPYCCCRRLLFCSIFILTLFATSLAPHSLTIHFICIIFRPTSSLPFALHPSFDHNHRNWALQGNLKGIIPDVIPKIANECACLSSYPEWRFEEPITTSSGLILVTVSRMDEATSLDTSSGYMIKHSNSIYGNHQMAPPPT